MRTSFIPQALIDACVRLAASPSRASAGSTQQKGDAPKRAPKGFQMQNILNLHPAQASTPSVQSTVQIVTPEMARHLRDVAHFSRQRNISKQNVARLASEMRAGRFTVGTQIYICVLPDGREMIVNGNHTLEAVAAAGVGQILTITRKAVADEDEAGRVYAVFDIQKIRTWRDSLRATGAGEDFPMAGNVLSAIGIIDGGFGTGSYSEKTASRLVRISKMEEYRDAASLIADAISDAPKNSSSIVRRAAIMAIALETARYQPSFASEFWGRMAHDNGLRVGMPERALLQWARSANTASGATSQREHSRAAALAWNAAWRGESRSFVKPNAMGAFVLLGTPYSSGLGV